MASSDRSTRPGLDGSLRGFRMEAAKEEQIPEMAETVDRFPPP